MTQPRSRPAALVGKEGVNHPHPDSQPRELHPESCCNAADFTLPRVLRTGTATK